MADKLTLTESMSQLRQRLHDIEYGDVNEGVGTWALGQLEKGYGKLTGKAAEEALIKQLGEKVTITNEKGQVQNWILRRDDRGTQYHLEGGDGHIGPEQMKTKKAAEPRKEPSIPAVQTEPHPTLLGPDGKPLQVPAKPEAPKPAIPNLNAPIQSFDPAEIVGTYVDWAKAGRPDHYKQIVKMTTAQKAGLIQAVGKKLKTAGRLLTLAMLIVLVGWYFKSDDEKVEPVVNTGSKTSEDGSAAIGTVIPGDEMNWSIINAGNLAGQSIIKGKDGVWKSQNGSTAVDPAVIEKIEEIAKQSPESRKQVLANQKNFSVELWPTSPASGSGNSDIATSQSAPVPTTTWGTR